MTANTSGSAKRGIDLLRDPQLNKSTVFTAGEWEALGLTRLLPAASCPSPDRLVALTPTALLRCSVLLASIPREKTS